MAEGAELRAYTGELTSKLMGALGEDLIGVWLLGSGALGGFELARSDVDVLVISRRSAPTSDRQAVADLIGPAGLPCPAQGIEFVWYAVDDVRPLGEPPSFLLNVNGGREREHKVQLGPGEEAEHWFVIDMAIARVSAVPLFGPPLADVAAPVPDERLHASLRQSLTWHDEFAPASPDRVLNAARMMNYLQTGTWTNKVAAGRRLADQHPSLAPAVTAALRARAEGGTLEPAFAAQVIQAAADLLGQA